MDEMALIRFCCVPAAGYEVGAPDGQLAGELHADAFGNPAPVRVLVSTSRPHLKLRSDGVRRTPVIRHSAGPHRYNMLAVDDPRKRIRCGVLPSQAKMKSTGFENSSAARGAPKRLETVSGSFRITARSA